MAGETSGPHSEGKAKGFTVQQSVQPPEHHVDVNVTLTTPGTAEVVLTYGAGNLLGVVRAWSLVVDKDCYVELHGDATSSSLHLKAGDQWWEENRAIAPHYAHPPDHAAGVLPLTKQATDTITILNAVLGEMPNIRGIIWGY